MSTMKTIRWSILILLALRLPARGEAAADGAPAFRNVELPLEQRVADLIGRLTLEEKIAQLEMDSPAIERLGIGSYHWWNESVHGVARAGRATIFPQAIALAATWDTQLMHRVAVAISDEARAKYREKSVGRYHGLTFFAPCINLIRDPRWGRAQEAYSEDPHLTTQMALAYIRGMQGTDPRYLKTAAIVKHFAVHSQETGRFETSFPVSERAMREYYFPAFQACLQDGQAAGLMAALNGINGVPCTANHWLLTDVLRDEWRFRGTVVTDYGAGLHLHTHHKFVASPELAVQAAFAAGIDVICNREPVFTNILTAVQSNLVTATVIDAALTRALTTRFRLGLFDPPERGPYAQLPPETVGRPEHLALAREACRASIVLLKNARLSHRQNPTPLLPLDRQALESVAVLGPFADEPYLGNYTGEPAEKPVGILAGLRTQAGDRVVVRHVPWYDLDRQVEELKGRKNLTAAEQQAELEQAQSRARETVSNAVSAARLSDVTVVVLGLGPKHENEFTDRVELGLPKDQREFIETIVAANPATVVVLVNGGPLTIPWIHDHVPAVLEAWLPGEQGGHAVAEILFGAANPAGRLPVTCYASLDQLPPLDDYEITRNRTYLHLQAAPLYPFGHGLSYTTFAYRDLQLDRPTVATNDTVAVTFAVANTGSRDGEEVVQLYVRDVAASRPVPQQQLRGFQRLALRRGETRSVTLPVRVADLALWDDQHHRWFIEPGDFEVLVGASARDIRLRATFRVE